MKREHIYFLSLAIIYAFSIWMLRSSYEPKVTVTCKTEAKCECDTSEVVKLRDELKKKDKMIYWMVRQRDSLRIECRRKDGIIGDTNVFKRMYFDNEGNLIKAN